MRNCHNEATSVFTNSSGSELSAINTKPNLFIALVQTFG